MKPKFMFINAINRAKRLEYSLPPLGLGYLVSSLRKKFGHNSIIFKIVDKDINKEINEYAYLVNSEFFIIPLHIVL